MKKIFFTLTIIVAIVSAAAAQCSVSPASSSPTLCVNTALTEPVTHITNNVTAIGSADNLPTGVAAILENNTIIISGIPTVAGTFNYSIPLIGEDCSTKTATGRITVTDLPTVFIVGANNICVGTTTTLSPTTGGTWTSNNPAVATVTNDGVVTGISYGTATFTFTATGTNCQATTDNVKIDNEILKLNDIVAKKKDDYSTPYILIYPNPEKEDLSYQWYSVCGENTIEIAGATEQFYYPGEEGLNKDCDYIVFVYKKSKCCGNFTAPYSEHKNAPSCVPSKPLYISPNPANGGYFVVSFNRNLLQDAENCVLSIYSLIGEKIWEQNLNSLNDITVSKTMTSGVYTITLTSDKGKYNEKIIVK